MFLLPHFNFLQQYYYVFLVCINSHVVLLTCYYIVFGHLRHCFLRRYYETKQFATMRYTYSIYTYTIDNKYKLFDIGWLAFGCVLQYLQATAIQSLCVGDVNIDIVIYVLCLWCIINVAVLLSTLYVV